LAEAVVVETGSDTPFLNPSSVDGKAPAEGKPSQQGPDAMRSAEEQADRGYFVGFCCRPSKHTRPFHPGVNRIESSAIIIADAEINRRGSNTPSHPTLTPRKNGEQNRTFHPGAETNRSPEAQTPELLAVSPPQKHAVPYVPRTDAVVFTSPGKSTSAKPVSSAQPTSHSLTYRHDAAT
jgi:hypothetical protein